MKFRIQLFVLAISALAISTAVSSACTPAQTATAHQIVGVGGTVCEAVFQAFDPALAPVCTTAENIANAFIAFTAAHAADGGATGASPTDQNAWVYGWLLAHGATPINK